MFKKSKSLQAKERSQFPIEAIIFDVDGVVFKSIDAHGKYFWSQNIKKDLGIRGEHLKKIFSKQWEDVTKGEIDTKEHLRQIFKDNTFENLNLTVDGYINYWLAHDNYVDSEMVSFAQSLKIPAYLGTNQDPYRTNHIKNLVGSSFKGVFSSYQIGCLKPEPGFYQHIEKTLHLRPDQLLLIDDTQANIEGANARGWNVYFYEDDLEGLKSFIGSLIFV